MAETDKKLMRMPVRLAIRTEGQFLNAYLALDNTMENARLIGSLHANLAEAPEIMESWKQLIRECVALTVQRLTGIKPVFSHEEPAPEHERSGHG